METLSPPRPLGIAILSWLHMIGGILGAIMFIVGFAHFRENAQMREAFAQLNLSPELLAVGLALIVVLSALAGVGMWRGKKWGWYLVVKQRSSFRFCESGTCRGPGGSRLCGPEGPYAESERRPVPCPKAPNSH